MSEITPNTPNPVREDEYYEALAAKLGIPASAIPRTPVWRNEEELAALVQLFTNMQGSSGGGVLVVHDVEGTLDKTWQEIADSDLCILKFTGEKLIQYRMNKPIGQGKYKVKFWSFDESSQFVYEADTSTDYPVYAEEP